MLSPGRRHNSLIQAVAYACVVFFVATVVPSLPRSDAAFVSVGTDGRHRIIFGKIDDATRRRSVSETPLTPLRSSSESSDSERLRNSASKLRKEAEELERTLSETKRNTLASMPPPPKKITYSDLRDSAWELTYRFSSEPLVSQDESAKEEPPTTPRKFYSGKVRIKFRSDRYTDVLPAPSGGGGANEASFRKFWGWDLETSQEDGLKYICFSADAVLPSSDAGEERIYFNARIDDASGAGAITELALNDCTVTVKRNIDPSKGLWGIFRGADGILAEFRKAGEFKCRPCSEAEEE